MEHEVVLAPEVPNGVGEITSLPPGRQESFLKSGERFRVCHLATNDVVL